MHSTDTHQQTKNKRGYTHPLSDISKSFITFAPQINKPVIDLGCGYGEAAIQALLSGAKKVIACDIEQEHLNTLHETITKLDNLSNNIETRLGRFPDKIDFEKNSIGAILASYVFPYLSPEELDYGLLKIYNWLESGGKLFICNYTVFVKGFTNEKFIKEYNKRLNLNWKWPGYMEDFHEFVTHDPENKTLDALPKKIHFFDKKPLVDALSHIGFEIEFAEFLDGKTNGAVKESFNDGRELIGIIAKKP